MAFLSDRATKRRDEKLRDADKMPHRKYRKRKPGEVRGRKMSQKSISEIERVQALWNSNPGETIVRIAYLTGVNFNNLRKWIERGHLKRPRQAQIVEEVRAQAEERSTPRPEVIRQDTPIDNAWDSGPVPSIESIRREIKRRMQSLILDPDAMSKYSTALARLDTIREKEAEEQDADAERCIVMIPPEMRRPEE